MARILVVEDRPTVREFIVETLRDVGGHTVDEGADDKAVDLVEDNEYDLFIVDVYLTTGDLRADGLDVIRAIQRKLPEAKFIIMSGKSMSQHVETAVLELGITHFLAKPVTVKDLLRKVKKALT